MTGDGSRPSAGWYVDPGDRQFHRYWTGYFDGWTDTRRPAHLPYWRTFLVAFMHWLAWSVVLAIPFVWVGAWLMCRDLGAVPHGGLCGYIGAGWGLATAPVVGILATAGSFGWWYERRFRPPAMPPEYADAVPDICELNQLPQDVDHRLMKKQEEKEAARDVRVHDPIRLADPMRMNRFAGGDDP